MNRIIILLAVLSGVTGLEAQDKITSSVFSNGGGTTAGANFTIQGTVGQGIIGRSGSPRDSLLSGFWNAISGLVTSVETLDEAPIPKVFRLEQNYPNPFNPSTTIQFSLPKASPVVITLYDLLGRQMATLVDDDYQPGVYKITFDAAGLASGVYVYRIQAGAYQASRKLMLMK
ncbi:MAG TPA: T9SS type A sorting domain-containing protein [Bacteroidetes bacterium]|nr:T9SS type A sorting domain-containing protein [Bacteroidota bacterium]